MMLTLIIKWCLCGISIVHAKPTTDHSYYLIEERVLEKLDYFMNQPKFALDAFQHFYNNGGFPNNLQAPDRDFALQFMYSLILTFQETGQVINYGLEDGLFLGYGFSDSENSDFLTLTYREPGESGYTLNDNKQIEKRTYFNTCVDSETGKGQNCTVKAGDQYISCIDDCSLTQCGDETSRSINCSMYPLESVSECESKIKWCKKYEIKHSVGMGGYVPTYEYCYNSKGAISEHPGEIVTNVSDGKMILGDCTFGSGDLVSRNLTGDFAQCQPNKQCNTTYMGGVFSINYDPRYRG